MEINWSKIFDWSVVDVRAPYAVYGKKEVLAYYVDVRYRHHGLRRVLFPVGRNRACITGHDMALSDAKRYFRKMCDKMKYDSRTM